MLDENAAKTIWIYRLMSLFGNYNDDVEMHLHKRLAMPMFSIDEDMGRLWGQWVPDKRLIRLNVLLFRNYEFGAVERVLKHEMGHMICSEIFGYHGGCSHGEHWKVACNALGMKNPTRCDSADYLMGLKGKLECPVSDRIRKLLAKGSCETVTKEESQVFLNKAQELMMRHQITMKDLVGSDQLFIKRPLGLGYYGKSFPAWMGQLGLLLQRHYSVNAITTYVWNAVSNRSEKYLEIFGMPDDVEIAEYAFYAIYNNGLALFEAAKKEHKRKLKEDMSYRNDQTTYSRTDYKDRIKSFTENSFMMGLICEFSRKLEEQKEVVEAGMNSMDQEVYALVSMENKGLLNEMYGKAYGRVRKNYSGAKAKGAGYWSGRDAGRGFNLSQGVRSGGNAGRLIGP